jgi:hypothetical protein
MNDGVAEGSIMLIQFNQLTGRKVLQKYHHFTSHHADTNSRFPSGASQQLNALFLKKKIIDRDT